MASENSKFHAARVQISVRDSLGTNMTMQNVAFVFDRCFILSLMPCTDTHFLAQNKRRRHALPHEGEQSHHTAKLDTILVPIGRLVDASTWYLRLKLFQRAFDSVAAATMLSRSCIQGRTSEQWVSQKPKQNILGIMTRSPAVKLHTSHAWTNF